MLVYFVQVTRSKNLLIFHVPSLHYVLSCWILIKKNLILVSSCLAFLKSAHVNYKIINHSPCVSLVKARKWLNRYWRNFYFRVCIAILIWHENAESTSSKLIISTSLVTYKWALGSPPPNGSKYYTRIKSSQVSIK